MTDAQPFVNAGITEPDQNAERLVVAKARREALARLEAVCRRRDGDAEDQHSQADDVLCASLRRIGMGDVADAFERVHKWYS